MDVGSCQTVLFQLPNRSIIYSLLQDVHQFYRPIHTYVSIFMCIFGTMCNFCNIVVLTRRTMRTPVNVILTAMACCDTVVLFSNLIYTTHFTFVAFEYCYPRHWSYGWAMFLIAHAHLSLVGHSSSVWLSVMLALIRYLTLRTRGKITSVQIGAIHSYVAIGSVILFVSVMNAPNFLTYQIIERPLNMTCPRVGPSVADATAFVPGISDLAMDHDCLVFRMAFWISGIVFKMVPCLLLTLFVWLLTRILNEVKQNRMRLLKGARPPPISPINGYIPSDTDRMNKRSSFPPIRPDPNSSDGHRPSNVSTNFVRNGSMRTRNGGRTDRTTRMLLVIVCVFLITELPQGIMAVLSGMFSEQFRLYIYNNVGDILDLLSLCGACTSFIIYCTMSAQFRNEFRRIFIPRNCWHLFGKSTRRESEGLLTSKTAHTFLRPSCADINGSGERSITLTMVGSTNSVRKIPPHDHNINHRNSAFRTPSPYSSESEHGANTGIRDTFSTKNGRLTAPDSGNTASSGYHTDREDPIQYIESPEQESKELVDPHEESSVPDTIDESVHLLKDVEKSVGRPNGSIYDEQYHL